MPRLTSMKVAASLAATALLAMPIVTNRQDFLGLLLAALVTAGYGWFVGHAGDVIYNEFLRTPAGQRPLLRTLVALAIIAVIFAIAAAISVGAGLR